MPKISGLVDAAATQLLERWGYDGFIAPLLWDSIKGDAFRYTGASLREKIWAYRRGFLAERIRRYGLCDENFHRFLSDFADKRMHPINGKYSRLIDDKLIIREVFSTCAQFLPKYHYHIRNNGAIRRMPDCPIQSHARAEVTEIVTTLKNERTLAAKPVAGSGGIGFLKLQYSGSDLFSINDQILSEQELAGMISRLRNYIVTEYLSSHPQIRSIYSHTPNTLRLVVINPHGTAPKIIGGFMRFGLRASGSVDNAGAGAIFCGVDLASGRLYGARRVVGDDILNADVHPDTGAMINDFVLPNWEAIVSGLTKLGLTVPNLVYMGYDIVITDEGFKFIEVNSLPDIQYMQPFTPIFDDSDAESFFKARMKRR